jgi:hypothetical protein
MNPKKASKLYSDVAEELELSVNLVEEVVVFYYSNLRQMLSNLTDPRINVEGLGHFVAKTKMVKNAIPRYTKSLENHDTSTFAAYFNKKGFETKLEKLIKLEKKIIEHEDKKEAFKKLKYENNTKKHLGE